MNNNPIINNVNWHPHVGQQGLHDGLQEEDQVDHMVHAQAMPCFDGVLRAWFDAAMNVGNNARIVHVNGSDRPPVNAARAVLHQLLNEEAVQRERAIDRARRVAPPACLNEALAVNISHFDGWREVVAGMMDTVEIEARMVCSVIETV